MTDEFLIVESRCGWYYHAGHFFLFDQKTGEQRYVIAEKKSEA